MSRRILAIALVCLLSAVVALCTVQAYFIWDGSQDGRVPASFEEGPYYYIYPTDSDPLPEQTWVPQEPYQAPPKEGTEIKWTVVQEGPGEPWHVVPGWTDESGTPTEEPVVPEKPVEDPTEGTPSAEPQPEEVVEVPDEILEEPSTPTLPEVEWEPMSWDETESGPGLTPSQVELATLADLEGKQDFSESSTAYSPRRYYGYYGRGQGQGQGQGQVEGDTAPGGIGSGETESALPRDVEESDIVNLQGDILYILNAYRGLIIVDVKDPSRPEVLSMVPVIGTPIDMYVVDHLVYMLVKTDYGFWYSTTPGQAQVEVAVYLPYQIGSKLVVVDALDPNDPEMLLDLPIEGFVSDSRRVGQVLYIVSSTYHWYNQYLGTDYVDLTYVVSINMMDPRNLCMIDYNVFSGASYVIHASTEFLFVSEWSSMSSGESRTWQNGLTRIIMVDISDPLGSMWFMDEFSFEGRVLDKYQMDQFGDTFRVVTQTREPWGSTLLTFDISTPDDVQPLGSLEIDDMGQLMATRFAGERAYTIHLPRSIDPLDVIDLSDPSDPVLCDVFEMPGWVTHMEVRGMKIIAIGVDDSGDERNVAVSLFDVSDPWNAVMEDRVRVGLSYATSEAITEPKALTVLDEQGLILVPFSTYEWDSSNGYRSFSGVQIVSFDLEEGDLSLRGHYEQATQVLRTRAIDNHVLSTSNDHLVVADITDPDEPLVITELELSPNVIDYHKVIGRYAEVTMVAQTSYYRYYDPADLLLRVFSDTVSEIETPLWEVEIGQCPDAWLWDGRYIHVFNEEKMEILHGWSIEAGSYRILKMTTYDLLGDGEGPISKRTLKIREWNETPFIPIGWYESISSSSYYYDYYQYNPSYNLMSDASNPVLLDGGYIAIYVQDELLIVGVGEYRSSLPVWSTDIECEGFLGLLAAGSGLYILSYEYVKTYYAGNAYRWTYQYEVSSFRYECFEGPDVGEPVQIPGLPLGCSDDGHWMYTVASWYGGTDTGWYSTFNVVSIVDGVATVAWAVDISNREVRVDGDTAILSEVRYKDIVDEDGNVHTVAETLLYVVHLPSFNLRWAATVDGGINLLHVGEDLALVRREMMGGVLLIDYREGSDVQHYWLHLSTTVYSVERHKDHVYVAMGKYGSLAIDLGT